MESRLLWLAEGVLGCQRWSKDKLLLDRHFFRAIAVVLACGKNPMLAQEEEMDLLPIRLYCDRCEVKRGNGGRKIMNWRSAVSLSILAQLLASSSSLQIGHYFEHDKWDSEALGLRSTMYSEMPINWQQVSTHLMPIVTKIEGVAAPFYDELEARTRGVACCPICDGRVNGNLGAHIQT